MFVGRNGEKVLPKEKCACGAEANVICVVSKVFSVKECITCATAQVAPAKGKK